MVRRLSYYDNNGPSNDIPYQSTSTWTATTLEHMLRLELLTLSLFHTLLTATTLSSVSRYEPRCYKNRSTY